MIEIDDKHKQVLQWAVQAYYEDYLGMKKDKLEELEALEESLAEMRELLASLGSPAIPSMQPSQPASAAIQQSGGGDISKEQDVEQIPPPESPKKSEKEQNQTSKLGADNVLRPDDLKLPAFEYDKDRMNPYKMIFFQEMPDGKVIIEYSNSHYYTTKETVMKIPYPFPVKYFSKENGWSSTVEQAFKNYRKYLAEQQPPSRLQKLKELATPSITKDDVLIDPFECDPSQGKEIEGYERSSVVELPDGRAMVQYNGSYYYTEKQKVMKLRYPVPKGYFDGVGLSSNAESSIRAYRHYLYLATQTQSNGDSGNNTDQSPEVKVEDEPPKNDQEENQDKEKPRLEFFKEDSGFDYASVAPQHIGGSTVYRSKAGKLVVKRLGKNTQGELLLTNDQDIDKLMNYDEKEVDWVIRSLSAEKRNILRGYLRDLKALRAVQ